MHKFETKYPKTTTSEKQHCELGGRVLVDEALKICFPTWPLQNIIAVNPFWKFRQQSFKDTILELEPALHQELMMPISWYLELYQQQVISEQSLRMAMDEATSRMVEFPKNLRELFLFSSSYEPNRQLSLTFAEYCDQKSGTDWQKLFVQYMSRFCASYFDRFQALAKSPFQNDGFWDAFHRFQKNDDFLSIHGLSNAKTYFIQIEDTEPKAYIEEVLNQLGMETHYQKLSYLRRVCVHILGWSSQFEYDLFQKSIGEHPRQNSGTHELVALAVALDQCLMQFNKKQNFDVGLFEGWKTNQSSLVHPESSAIHPAEVAYIWQTALEYSLQASMVQKISSQDPSSKTNTLETRNTTFQIAMCIDVRSEGARYFIEQEKDIDTLGVAGFFGAKIYYNKDNEVAKSPRLPALLKGSYDVYEKPKSKKISPREKAKDIRAYLRNLRKAPFSSFVYVELLGGYTVFNFWKRLRDGLWDHSNNEKKPKRFDDKHHIPEIDTNHMCLKTRVSTATGFLQSLSYRPEQFGRIFVIAGHGSQTENNHLGSSLDCGACGGNAGDVNARVMSQILNEKEVRSELAKTGMEISSQTIFVAAIHETVTNELYILDEEKIPKSHLKDLNILKDKLTRASAKYRGFSHALTGTHLDQNAFRRTKNWSEIRPEWGLAGNVGFVIGPRNLTRKFQLQGRYFLHEYNHELDPGNAVLSQIFAGPVVVTNWINLQYYSSTVAPGVYGAGNKVLHNLTGENAVIEGAGGDLRAGLSFQSIHNGEKWMHTPARLSVYVEASLNALEGVVEGNTMIKDLVDNGWMYLLRVDPETGKVFIRKKGGLYLPFQEIT